jgi:outer membrane protein
MKKYLQLSLVMVLLGVAHNSFCQFNKGRFIAGGSVRFSSSNLENVFSGNTTETRVSTFSFSPNVGYFIIDKLAIGASVGLSTSRYAVEAQNVEAVNSTASIGPFMRYYLPKPIFFQAAAMLGTSKLKGIQPTETESNRALTQLGLAAGYAYLFNDFVALEPMIGYQTYTTKDKPTGDKATDGTFYLSCALTIYLGARK